MHQERKFVWLDCDPGHDDAFAIILAGHHPSLNLLGISTVYGNQTVHKTTSNALNVAYASGLSHIGIVKGSEEPLLRVGPSVCPEIHGESGLDRLSNSSFPSNNNECINKNAIVHMYEVISCSPQKVTLICTACLTNIALLLKVFPQVKSNIEQVVILGGSVGTGNIGPVSEWNIMLDPEASRIVFESRLPLVQIPLEVTHTALVTPDILSLFTLNTPFSSLFIDLLLFFQSTYKSTFDFDFPPLHDPLAVAYVIDPSLFTLKLIHVDIETQSPFSSGQTICDMYGVTQREKNVRLAVKMDVPPFWALLAEAFKKADQVSPMNK